MSRMEQSIVTVAAELVHVVPVDEQEMYDATWNAGQSARQSASADVKSGSSHSSITRSNLILPSPTTSPMSPPRRMSQSNFVRSPSIAPPSPITRTNSSNCSNSTSNRRMRKQQQQSANKKGGGIKNMYWIIPAVLGVLYLIAICTLACWECFVQPERVRRLNEDGSLAVEYHKNTERVPNAAKHGPESDRKSVTPSSSKAAPTQAGSTSTADSTAPSSTSTTAASSEFEDHDECEEDHDECEEDIDEYETRYYGDDVCYYEDEECEYADDGCDDECEYGATFELNSAKDLEKARSAAKVAFKEGPKKSSFETKTTHSSQTTRSSQTRINLDDPTIANIDLNDPEQENEIWSRAQEVFASASKSPKKHQLQRSPLPMFASPAASTTRSTVASDRSSTNVHKVATRASPMTEQPAFPNFIQKAKTATLGNNRQLMRLDTLADGTKVFQCGEWATVHPNGPRADKTTGKSLTKKLTKSRDIIILAGRWLFGSPPFAVKDMSQTGMAAFMKICQFAEQSGLVDSITALNMEEKVTPADLLANLNELKTRKMIAMLPVAALVTPNTASSQTIVDWMNYGTPEERHSLRFWVTRNWFPVDAHLAVEKARGATKAKTFKTIVGDTKRQTLSLDGLLGTMDDGTSYSSRGINPLHGFTKEYGGLPTFAIFGRLDKEAETSAETLAKEALADTGVLERFSGDCLLNAPLDVSDAIMTYLRHEDDFHLLRRKRAQAEWK